MHNCFSVRNLRSDGTDCHSYSSSAPESQDESYVGDLPFRYDQQADEDGFYATSFHVKDEYPLGGGRLKLKNSGQFGDGNRSVMLGLSSLCPTLTLRRCRRIKSEPFTIVAPKE